MCTYGRRFGAVFDWINGTNILHCIMNDVNMLWNMLVAWIMMELAARSMNEPYSFCENSSLQRYEREE